jgi:flagellar hook assembly protein FlgD
LLSFELEASKEVQIDVYDISGYHIHTISGGFFNTGLNDITWDAVTESGMKVGSGVYLITMRADGISCWKKVIITR